MKYPLTPKAKEAAKYLVEAWNSGALNQEFSIGTIYEPDPFSRKTRRKLSTGFGVLTDTFSSPPIESLKELAFFQLIHIEVKYAGKSETPNYYILLLQELRNSVENDFEVSDYFLTFNAVGTIIQGNATISAPFQSSASIYGDISQQITLPEVADKLTSMLDRDVLQADPQLTAAIEELRTSLESERQSKLGKVISQLGRCLEHVSNTKGVIEAIAFVALLLRSAG